MNGAAREPSSQCCIAGGGPAGLVLGFLLARCGVQVTVLEKHEDFLRDFRHLPAARRFLVLVPQWDFLDFIARRWPSGCCSACPRCAACRPAWSASACGPSGFAPADP